MLKIDETLKTAFLLFFTLTLLTGLLYPLSIMGIAQLFFSHQANGSLLLKNQQIIGSELIGQFFDDPRYFLGRISATLPEPYNATTSGGSNFSIENSELLTRVKKSVQFLHSIDPGNTLTIPLDLVTASGSGLDPEISPFAAYYQAKRIARLRHLSEENVNTLIQKCSKKRTLYLLGEPRINVLKLNLALDNLAEQQKSNP